MLAFLCLNKGEPFSIRKIMTVFYVIYMYMAVETYMSLTFL